MLTAIDPQEFPAAAGNKLYLDYIAGVDPASGFYTYPPLDYSVALAGRRKHTYPRQAVARRLAEYNTHLGADPRARRMYDYNINVDKQ